jgi:hypothetical protein
MKLSCYLCVGVYPPQPNFMKLGTYVMEIEPISTAYFVSSSNQSLCIFIALIIATQRLGKHVPTAANTSKNRIIV